MLNGEGTRYGHSHACFIEFLFYIHISSKEGKNTHIHGGGGLGGKQTDVDNANKGKS